MYEFRIEKERRKRLGKELSDKRLKEQLSVEEVASLVGVRPIFLKRLEEGEVSIINPLFLIKLGSVLKINYMILYQILGYVHNQAVLKYLTAENDIYPLSEIGE